MRRLVLALSATAVLAGLLPAGAQASFHEIKVREVYVGTSGDQSVQYVEVQLPDAGERFTSGHALTLYEANGTAHNVNVATNVPAVDQETVLFATTSSVLGVSRDFVMPASLSAAGGAVCWASVDCVSWGSFSAMLPSPAGVPAAAIPSGKALVRGISAHCPTALDVADDTDSSADDFAVADPDPRNTAAIPTETRCLPPRITIKGRRKTTDRTPTFRFVSSEDPVTYRCKVDARSFRRCDTPYTTPRLRPGSHALAVRAKDSDGDVGKARKAFKVIRRR